MTPPYDTASLSDLRERTEYEAWLLEAVYEIVGEPVLDPDVDEMIYPADGGPPTFTVFLRARLGRSDWRPQFLDVGAPLVFATAFKLLDMLIEWVLAQGGGGVPYRFTEKIARLGPSVVFPQLIQTRSWLRERLLALYQRLEPLRGTIIHDRHFETEDGGLRVSGSKRGTVGPEIRISRSELRSLAVLLVSVVRYVGGTWTMDPFRERLLGFELDQLLSMHGLRALRYLRPHRAHVRVYAIAGASLAVDLDATRRHLETWCPGDDVLFDLRIVSVARDGTHATAYLVPWERLETPGFRLPETLAELEDYQVTPPEDFDLVKTANALNRREAA